MPDSLCFHAVFRSTAMTIHDQQKDYISIPKWRNEQ